MPEPCGLRARTQYSLEAGGMRDDPEYDALMVLLETRAAENGYPGERASEREENSRDEINGR